MSRTFPWQRHKCPRSLTGRSNVLRGGKFLSFEVLTWRPKTRPFCPPNGGLVREIPLFLWKCSLVNLVLIGSGSFIRCCCRFIFIIHTSIGLSQRLNYCIYVPGSGPPPHPPCHGHGHNINPPPPCGMGGSWEGVGVIQPTAMQLVG